MQTSPGRHIYLRGDPEETLQSDFRPYRAVRVPVVFASATTTTVSRSRTRDATALGTVGNGRRVRGARWWGALLS
jgi:hypothetical protein